jgi:hypothetical protein
LLSEEQEQKKILRASLHGNRDRTENLPRVPSFEKNPCSDETRLATGPRMLKREWKSVQEISKNGADFTDAMTAAKTERGERLSGTDQKSRVKKIEI